jgi:NTE family protein
MAESDEVLDHIIFLIRLSGAFSTASDECVRSLAEVVSWMSIPGGSTLFSQGDVSNAIYITSSGLLGAYTNNTSGAEILVGRIGRGELIGEMGCVSNEPRSTTIRALRNSEILMVPWESIEPLARIHPILMLSLCQTVIGRMRGLVQGKKPKIGLRTYCLIPCESEHDAREFVDDLVSEFQKFGPTFLVTKENGKNYTTEQLVALEASNDYVIYLADAGKTPWTRLCLRQADTALVIAQGLDAPRPIPSFGEINAGISTSLILLWPGEIIPGKTGPWLDSLRPRAHHHVRSPSDIGRAARLLTGKGLGIVLAGGGARGLAHVGVIRAFAEHGIVVDAVVGTSIGALVGSSIAMEWDYLKSRAAAHRFSRRHPLWELVPPLRSLLSGRNLRVSLQEWHGETHIEETPIPFACVSASLNTSAAAIHQRGKLETWVRASASLPGIFPPVLENGALYVDGGVINNLPTDTIHAMGVGFVVAVELGAGNKTPARTLPSIMDVLLRVATMGSNARNLSAREQCDVLLNPSLEAVDLLNFRAYDLAMQVGYDCAIEKIEQIKLRLSDKVAASVTSPLPAASISVSGQ